MRKLLALLILLFAIAIGANAQDASRQYTVTNTTPDTSFAAGTLAYHQISWVKLGTVSACAVKLQQSADRLSWSDLIANQTCTSSGQSAITNVTATWVRIDPTSFTGAGSVVVNYSGWVNNPAAGGTPTLNSVLDPTADKTFAMGAHVLSFSGTGGNGGSVFFIGNGPTDALVLGLNSGGFTVNQQALQITSAYSGTNDLNNGGSPFAGIYTSVGNLSSHAVGAVTGIYIDNNFNAGGGSLANNYGIFMLDQTAGTNNWAIKTGLGKVEFGDVLQLDGDNPYGASVRTSDAECETAYAPTTLSLGGLTTDTGLSCLPANATIDAVVYRITTAITGATTSFQIGDASAAGRFCLIQSTLTLGATGVCLNQHAAPNNEIQATAAAVRVTTVGIPTAGAVRLIVYYRIWTPPTS